MPPQVQDRLPPITPQLAMRVAVLGGFAFVLFGIVFFRLWFLQVLSGQDYIAQARDNRVRRVPIAAARGDIVDSQGNDLVTTINAPVVALTPNSLPKSVQLQAAAYQKQVHAAYVDQQKAIAQAAAYDRQLKDDGHKQTKRETRELHRLERAAKAPAQVRIPPLDPGELKTAALYKRLGHVIGIKPATIQKDVIASLANAPYSNVVLKTGALFAQYAYIREHAEQFPGVIADTTYLRKYPSSELAAQLFGTVGQISADELKSKRFPGATEGTRVGQTGLENEYDADLRGTDGYTRIVVNAAGARDDQAKTSEKPPIQGQQLKLTINSPLQRAADDALKRGIAAAPGATAGAYVAMDPRNGAILAVGSQPSFDANLLAKPFTQKTFETLTSDSTSAPLLERALQSAYPTGSIFKPFTALAALQSGRVDPYAKYDDQGKTKIGTQDYQNAGAEPFGSIDMSDALKFSSDLYFFNVGATLAGSGDIQRMASAFGFGHLTGVDVPGETPGLLPTRAFLDKKNAAYEDCIGRHHLQQSSQPALYTCGGYERPWTDGDDLNLAVGQGYLQATPLQVATAYSALENGGRVVTPHVGQAIEDASGATVHQLSYPAKRRIKLKSSYLELVRHGLYRAANEQGGTSVDVFKGFPKQYPVYGKTGTAERPPNPDQAWYACYVPDAHRPIVVVVTIEKGGFGADTAAPVARLILSQWFDVKDRTFHAGSDKSN